MNEQPQMEFESEIDVIEHDPKLIQKIKKSLNSRKFWLTVGLISLATTMYGFGDISSDVFITIVAVAVGIYTGTLGFEDGMRKIVPLLLPTLRNVLPLINEEE